MVIPIGGGGGGAPQLAGPPPAAANSSMQVIKMSVILTLVLCIAQVVSGGVALGSNFAVTIIVQYSLNFILSTFFGIFILKDDDGQMFNMRSAYQCVASTCCSICADQCGGGAACLMPFIIWNAFNIIFALIPMRGSNIYLAINITKVAVANVPAAYVCMVSCILIIVSQLWGTLAAWRAYKICQESAGTGPPGGGDWAYSGGGQTGGNGGGGGGGQYNNNYNARPPPTAPSGGGQRAQNVALFQGSGQRLGG